MPNDKTAPFDEIVELVDIDRKVTVLLGAGASATGGIPLANGIVSKALEDYKFLKQKVGANPTYADCMDQLQTGFRQKLVRAVCAEAKINWAHVALAQLMKAGFVNRVLTTNFDSLLVRACALIGEFPAVYDLAATQVFTPSLAAEQAIFYLHGQQAGMVQVHTTDQFDEVKDRLRKAIDAAHQHQTWIVIGYSGANDPLVQVLAERSFVHGLYWVGYRDDPPNQYVMDKLIRPSSDCRVVSGYDADRFLVELARRKGVFPPSIISKPFSSLRTTLDSLAPYSPEEESTDFTMETRRMVQAAIEVHELGNVPPEKADSSTVDEASPAKTASDVLEAWASVMAGEYDKVVENFEAASGPRRSALAPVAAHALLEQGNQRAGREGAVGTPPDLALAMNKYAAALKIKPDFHEALINWGIALGVQAKSKSGAEADRLFVEAGEKFAAALKIKPDKHEALYNWGTALLNQAGTKSGAEADRLFVEAGEKFAAALEIKPDKHEALNNWGNMLLAQAKTKSGAEAHRLFVEAEKKYAAAFKIKPDDHEALNNWGNALLAQATTKSGAEADRLFVAAAEKYAAALKIKPDDHDVLKNWGGALLVQAKTKSGAEADRIQGEAEQHLQRAEALVPGSGSYNLACFAALRGKTQEALKYLSRCTEFRTLPPRAHLEADPDLDSVRKEPWFETILRAADDQFR